MENQVTLTDDELSVIMAALDLSIKSAEMYVQVNGEDSLDLATKQASIEMREVRDRLKKEYF